MWGKSHSNINANGKTNWETNQKETRATGNVMHCLGVCLDPGFGFGVGVPESGVGWDGTSASGLLHRLDFRVWYLAIGRGRVTGCDSEAVDSTEGMLMSRSRNTEEDIQQ